MKKLTKREIIAWSKEQFPCEPPCDSFGVCSNCSDALLLRVGATWANDKLILKNAVLEARKLIKRVRG